MDIKAIFYSAIAGVVIVIYSHRLVKKVISKRRKHRSDKTAKFEAEHQRSYDEIADKWRKLRDDTRIVWDQYLQAKVSHDKRQRRSVKKEASAYIEFCEDFTKQISHVISHDHSMLRKWPQADLDRICYQHHAEWYRIQDALTILIARAKYIHKNEMSKGW